MSTRHYFQVRTKIQGHQSNRAPYAQIQGQEQANRNMAAVERLQRPAAQNELTSSSIISIDYACQTAILRMMPETKGQLTLFCFDLPGLFV